MVQYSKKQRESMQLSFQKRRLQAKGSSSTNMIDGLLFSAACSLIEQQPAQYNSFTVGSSQYGQVNPSTVLFARGKVAGLTLSVRSCSKGHRGIARLALITMSSIGLLSSYKVQGGLL